MLKEKKGAEAANVTNPELEFRCKAVNTQQTVTIIDAIHVAGSSTAGCRTVSGEKNEGSEALRKARPNGAGPTRAEVPARTHAETLRASTTYSNPPVQEVMEGADNQGAGEQGRPVRQNLYRGYRPRFRRGPPRQTAQRGRQ